MCNHVWVYKGTEGKVTARCRHCNAETPFFLAPITPKTRALLLPTTQRAISGNPNSWDNVVKLEEARV